MDGEKRSLPRSGSLRIIPYGADRGHIWIDPECGLEVDLDLVDELLRRGARLRIPVSCVTTR